MTAGHHLVGVSPAAARQWASLQDALDDQPSTPCRAHRDPDLWWSWASSEEASALCWSCPVLAECGAFAAADGVRWGTWAGRWHGREDGA